MGTYHSYPGDAKLEDSKDNWYRISGMNISRWNLTTWGNTSRSLWDYRTGGGFVLAKAGIGLASKSHWSDLLYKALKQDDTLTLLRGESTPTGVVDGFVRFIWTGGNNNMDSLDITGNSFDFKNRLTKVDGAADTLALNCTTSQGGLYGKAGTIFYNMYNIESTLHANNYYFRDTPIEPNRNSCCFRPMLTLKPVDPGITNPIVLSCRINSKLIDRNYGPNNQRFGWDRTIKFDPLYSAHSIKQIELVLNVDAKGNSTGNGIGAAVVMAGIVPPKNDETICIEYRMLEAIESSNSYTLKVTFNNNKALYIQDALVTTGASPLAQDKTQTRIYRMSDLV